MWQALLHDLQQQISQPVIATKFHKSLANAIVEMVKDLRTENVINQVVLSGGVFQNSILLQQVSKRLEALEINILTHSLVPSNDGGFII
jgi:hydrogenase maturation protein HypF